MMTINTAAFIALPVLDTGIILTTYIAHTVCPGFMYTAK